MYDNNTSKLQACGLRTNSHINVHRSKKISTHVHAQKIFKSEKEYYFFVGNFADIVMGSKNVCRQ
jgi:hypothetical protein